MQKIKNIAKERSNGLLLILLAVLSISSLFLNYHLVRSENKEPLVSVPTEEQVLGETNSNSEEIILDENKAISTQDAQEEKIIETTDVVPDPEDIFYAELKAHLKKYCGQNFNVKKCQDFLAETKDARTKGARFKELYKKYHFEKKTEKKSTVSADVTSAKSGLTITSSEESKAYETTVVSGISALDLMNLLQKDNSQNFSYHSSSDFVDKINGIENSGNMSWMLYACKGNTCKLTSVGASNIKIGDWDKIEWKYLDWTTIDWNMW